jgi:hypothetical protein
LYNKNNILNIIAIRKSVKCKDRNDIYIIIEYKNNSVDIDNKI